MTRETKIGLLVGLAFIIVIGILLEEHLSSTNEPQQAALSGAGANVRDGVTTPAGSDGDGPPVTIAGDAADGPRRPVPTHDDLRAGNPPVAFVRPGRSAQAPAAAPPPGATPDGPVVSNVPTPPAGPEAATPPAAPLVPNPVDPPSARLPRGTRELLLQHPSELAAVDAARGAGAPASPARPVQPAPGVPGAPAAPAPIAGQYVATPGDNLSHMAARLMGANTKANRELLIRANPSLQAEGNPVIAGRTYVIPGLSGKAATASAAGAAGAPPETNGGDASRGPRAGGFQWYTVRGNDNLWKIAESQLGNGNAWTTIRDMNKDVLKGGETVHPNMRLRLPGKAAVAGAD